MYRKCFCLSVSLLKPNKKVTECEITKTEVGNEIKIFITLIKYNTCQRREEGNCY